MNQNPKQLARDTIDAALIKCGWIIQNKSKINLSATLGVAVREYQTNTVSTEYVFFVKKAVVIIDANGGGNKMHAGWI